MKFKTNWIYPELAIRGFDRLGQYPIPQEPIRNMNPYLVYHYLKTILADADCVKDVKALHFWPILAEAFPQATWVVVWRDPKKIAASCMRTKFMKHFDSPDAWEAWAETHHTRCKELQDRYPDRVYVVNASHLGTDTAALSSAVRASGLQWDEASVGKVFEPSRWTG